MDKIKKYLSEIGRKGGQKSKAPGNQNARKYKTEEDRAAARKRSQDAYRLKIKLIAKPAL